MYKVFKAGSRKNVPHSLRSAYTSYDEARCAIRKFLRKNFDVRHIAYSNAPINANNFSVSKID